jgi:hypothetical protein
VDDGQIDSEAAASDLPPDIQALAAQSLFHGHLKRRISFSCPVLGDLARQSGHPALGIVEVGAQHTRSYGLDASEVDVARVNGTHQDDLVFGAGDDNVQPSLAALHVQRAETHGKLALLIMPIPNAYDDSVTFITLNVFQVLDEEGLISIFPKAFLHFRPVPAQPGQLVIDGIPLPLIERNHTKRIVGVLVKKLEDEARRFACLGGIVAASAAGTPTTIRHELKLHSRRTIRVVNAGKRGQFVCIEVMV